MYTENDYLVNLYNNLCKEDDLQKKQLAIAKSLFEKQYVLEDLLSEISESTSLSKQHKTKLYVWVVYLTGGTNERLASQYYKIADKQGLFLSPNEKMSKSFREEMIMAHAGFADA